MSGIKIIYDGDCPFCSRYVVISRLRSSVGPVTLVNAREGGPDVEKALADGYDLNEGMLAYYEGRAYYGHDCVHLISLLSSRYGPLNKIASALFSNRTVARFSYPLLRFGRNVTLRVLGRKKIQSA
ncbi:DCC1-like thiol-disulfide oxidoreductase family protein [Roseibium polysiphoniae]|uniref:DCC1-like thiol-disulfide oxidoreductase family protein n=1 Tax=Roseibium polysiphoniae TaxID=2571221 RepID=UPI0025988C57|nr:DCC1-like thiol-disulfide oxidoreductase family protein [uncultured Roseibium sp.]